MVGGLSQKLEALTRILEVITFDAMIIFTKTKTMTIELAEKLSARGFSAEAINGDIQQTAAKANKSSCFIRRNLNVQSQTIKERAYQTLISPKLEYCCTFVCRSLFGKILS
jgi:superfamily II DNA/RNA helicase